MAIKFDEEIRKFQPSQEVEETENQIKEKNVPDITEILERIIAKTSEKN